MLVFLRVHYENFEKWGIPLIIKQIRSKDNLISATALEIINEACHDQVYLEEIIAIWPFQTLCESGDLGSIISTKLFSITKGLNRITSEIICVIENWSKFFNRKYVLMIESDMHTSQTLSMRPEDRHNLKRMCFTRTYGMQPNILPHLYGQLTKTKQGIAYLKKFGKLENLLQILKNSECKNENVCLNVKASLWALGHISTSYEGIKVLTEVCPNIYKIITSYAKTSDVYSLRATAFNVLGLIASSQTGANILSQLNWISVTHDRNTFWPVNYLNEWSFGLSYKRSQDTCSIRNKFLTFAEKCRIKNIETESKQNNM